MDHEAEQKIIDMLDVLAREVGAIARDVGEIRRTDLPALNTSVMSIEENLADFRAETSANFNRTELRFDTCEKKRFEDHEERRECVEQLSQDGR